LAKAAKKPSGYLARKASQAERLPLALAKAKSARAVASADEAAGSGAGLAATGDTK
jgi:hypothetical protein